MLPLLKSYFTLTLQNVPWNILNTIVIIGFGILNNNNLFLDKLTASAYILQKPF